MILNSSFLTIQLPKKILVILNDGCDGYYIAVKTTSRGTFKSVTYGCQATDRYPNFFLPVGSCCLKKNTWTLLDQFFELTAHLLLTKHFTGQIHHIGILKSDLLKQLLECAIICDDITLNQKEILEKVLTGM